MTCSGKNAIPSKILLLKESFRKSSFKCSINLLTQDMFDKCLVAKDTQRPTRSAGPAKRVSCSFNCTRNWNHCLEERWKRRRWTSKENSTEEQLKNEHGQKIEHHKHQHQFLEICHWILNTAGANLLQIIKIYNWSYYYEYRFYIINYVLIEFLYTVGIHWNNGTRFSSSCCLLWVVTVLGSWTPTSCCSTSLYWWI